MYGPKPEGFWSNSQGAEIKKAFKFLSAGNWYIVVEEFIDFDGDKHTKGEKWKFLGSSFCPYNDGASWFVSLNGENEWDIRLQWRQETQSDILERPENYIEESF